MQLFIRTLALLLLVLICLAAGILVYAATPGPTIHVCATPVTPGTLYTPTSCPHLICGPLNARDAVRTIDPVSKAQVFEPFAALTGSSPAVNCKTGAWGTVGGFNAGLPPAPPPPPPPPPPPAPTFQVMTVCRSDTPTVCAQFPHIPAGVTLTTVTAPETP